MVCSHIWPKQHHNRIKKGHMLLLSFNGTILTHRVIDSPPPGANAIFPEHWRVSERKVTQNPTIMFAFLFRRISATHVTVTFFQAELIPPP